MIGPIGYHDLGGNNDDILTKIDVNDHPLTYFEKSIHALLVCLAKKNIMTTDELRRGVEQLEEQSYKEWGYYERWSVAIAAILLERQIITEIELNTEIDGDSIDNITQLFQPGDSVYVKSEDTRIRWRKPHLRVPGYIFGAKGIIERYNGKFEDPYLLAFRGKGPSLPLYTVSFKQKDIWKPFPSETDGSCDDSITVEIYQSWLLPVRGIENSHDHEHNHEKIHSHDINHCENEHQQEHIQEHQHQHEHQHGHHHDNRAITELNAVIAEGPEGPGFVIGNCIIKLLETKSIIMPGEIQNTISSLENMKTSLLGATLVARAWVDENFKKLLLTNAQAAGQQLGISTSNPNAPTVLIVVENTDEIHNLCVCTLCSCYPSSLLGLSPSWYKSRSYRCRAIREPRKVLLEFGTVIPNNVKIVVHDSTADTRYMVLPQRPTGTDHMTEDELKFLITRDSLVGVTRDLIVQ